MKKGFCWLFSILAVLFIANGVGATAPAYYAGCSEWALGADGYWYRACHVSHAYHRYGTASYNYPTTISLSSGSPSPDQTEFQRELFAAYKDKAEKYETLLKAALASGGAIPPELRALAAPPHPGAILEKQDCMRCHSAEDGASSGGKHVMYRGGIWVGTPEQAGEAVKRVRSGDMPRGGKKWTGEQKFDWLDYATSPAAEAAKGAPPKLEAPKAESPKLMPPTKLIPDVSFRSPRS